MPRMDRISWEVEGVVQQEREKFDGWEGEWKGPVIDGGR